MLVYLSKQKPEKNGEKRYENNDGNTSMGPMAGGGIVAYHRFDWVILNKLQGKVVTPTEKLEWWIILIVNYVTIL